MNFILGSGRLGAALISLLDSQQVIKLDRSVYSTWWRDDAVRQIVSYFKKWAGLEGTVYIACGVINPNIPAEEHHRANFLLPKNVIEGVAQLGFRVISFGTVMEKIINTETANPYFSSKIKLGTFASEFSTKSKLLLHIRMHTVYGGGLPAKFMFLGGIFYSIMNKIPFNMSNGAQLREYHHVDDDMSAILRLVALQSNGIMDLSHAAPIELRTLAKYIFEHFNSLDLLNIGGLPQPLNENYGTQFERTPLLNGLIFRDTLPAIVHYMRVCMATLGEKKCMAV